MLNAKITDQDANDIRAQHVARLTITATMMNSNPDQIVPVVEALERVLEIASYCPGGQQALLDGLRASSSAQEILAFCKAFVHVVAIASEGVQLSQEDVPQPVHDYGLMA